MKIAIVGAGKSLEKGKSLGDEYFVMTTGSVAQALDHADIIVEIHEGIDPESRRGIHTDALIYGREKKGNVSRFPINELVNKYGYRFDGTMSMILAMAIEMKPESIELFGVDFALDSEYATMRANFMYFLGIAKGRGIEIISGAENDILAPCKLYAYHKKTAFEENIESFMEMTRKELAAARALRDQENRRVDFLRGVQDAQEYILRNYGGQ